MSIKQLEYNIIKISIKRYISFTSFGFTFWVLHDTKKDYNELKKRKCSKIS